MVKKEDSNVPAAEKKPVRAKAIKKNTDDVSSDSPKVAKKVAAPTRLVDELSETMGGLLISDKSGSIYKGGKLNKIPQRRPIKFLV